MVLYGGGSIGGLINIVIKKGQLEIMMEFEVGIKSGFNSSKDYDECIVGVVFGGNDYIFGCFFVVYQKFGGWFDGNGDVILFDNIQIGLQYFNWLDIMGIGMLNIDEFWQF